MDPHIKHSLPGPGPAKKRKRNPGLQRHWDDPEQQSGTLPYDDDAANMIIEEDGAIDDSEEEVESRELTQGEIWDDSALIDAWESATAEYEAYHGKGKDWKKEPVKKSPLWYNVPPDPSKLKTSTEGVQGYGVTQSDPENSRPVDFETFVPNHDPSLALAQPSQPAYETYGIPPAPGEHVNRDEAFNRALGAMYWAGYWTAVYHGHGNNDKEVVTHEIAANGHHEEKRGKDEGADSQDEDEELLISTQR
ncbi:hypothetical protein DFH94DRAFT_718587 [Russula ochroleuca]|jgi:hypothetical protein|uniref:Survival Motor Neuron Gemin2-binding domain-containing protein n=1 Tax=Russula ochroleuca TaxID=152965 RepID=A0A9P5N3I5_9AGAM|nr:hypothetical protein DFH94DRAFT_718587 [Russula ochroleuca]